MRKLIALPVLFVLVGALAGCPDAHQKTLRATLIGLNAARDGFVTWDMAHQTDIVEAATTFEDGQNQLREYRQAREKVVLGFEVAYKLLAAAALDPSSANMSTMLAAAKDVYDVVIALKNRHPSAEPASAPSTSPGTGATP